MACATDVEQVRLLIGDLDTANQLFTDAQLSLFASIGGSALHGAAHALDTIATSEALLSKKIRTADGLSTDGPAVADALRKHAAALRERALAEDNDDEGFIVVDFQPYPLSAAELTEWAFAWPVGV